MHLLSQTLYNNDPFTAYPTTYVIKLLLQKKLPTYKKKLLLMIKKKRTNKKQTNIQTKQIPKQCIRNINELIRRYLAFILSYFINNRRSVIMLLISGPNH